MTLTFFHHLKDTTMMSMDLTDLRDFIEQRRTEFGNLLSELSQSIFSSASVAVLRDYIHKADTSGRSRPLLHEAQFDKGGLFGAYVGNIRGPLESRVRRLELLTGDDFARHQVAQLEPESTVAGGSADELDELKAEKEALPEFEPEQDGSRMKPPDEPWSFEEALAREERTTGSREVLSLAADVLEILRTRLRVLETFEHIFSQPRIECDYALQALTKSYSELLTERVQLVSLQERCCEQLTERLAEYDLQARVFTWDAERTIAEHDREIDNLNNLGNLYRSILSAPRIIRLQELGNSVRGYDQTVRRVTEDNPVMTSQDDRSFLVMPVEVELRQGNVYRNFRNLSFGQRSGIILHMVLSTTDRPVVVIDQPEDNLDAHSIVNMLTPALQEFSHKGQVIIATHNSSLVMGLQPPNLVVMESQGETGRLKLQGVTSVPSVLREMLEVLEGGLETFNEKMRIYEQFITRLSGSIADMDLAFIESSFRRRTIDSLRNFLQPVISDRSLLDFARHQLKQPDPSRLHVQLKDLADALTIENTNDPERVFSQLREVIVVLDNHISRLQAAIEDIRLLDTTPKVTSVELYDLLRGLRDDYAAKLTARAATIDLDEALRGFAVRADPDHLKLVFRNLLSNSLRATERRALASFVPGQSSSSPTEAIRVTLEAFDESRVVS